MVNHHFEYTTVVDLYDLNKLRRAISDQPGVPVKRKRFVSDNTTTTCYITGDVIFENREPLCSEHASSNDAVVPQPCEISIPIEEESTILVSKKMHPIQASYRRIVPDHITCHQVWLLIHILVAIVLCVLYFTHFIDISAGTIAICELLCGVLVRNEIFIAFLHRLIALIPYFKYELNRMLHCIGGIHASCGINALFWLLISLACEHHGLGVRITSGFILFLILLLSITAIPIIRRRFHNKFEHVHRYAGWTSLLILIIHVIFLQIEKFDSFSTKALFNEAVLILITISIIILLPWICVRQVFVEYKQPSKDLTIITFPKALYPYGSTTRISLDGHEWHAFAIALTDPYTDQHSVLVAAVGDWTKYLAENYRAKKLPERLWIRKIKGLGFMYSIHAYRKVLIVCTGSGIAPALPYIKDPLPTTHIHLLWIAKQHEQTYGEYVWKLVQKLSPHFTLHDTAIHGRPGPELIEKTFWQTQSEAVFIVSNEKLTTEVTNALWRKAIPCFGALFDS